MKSQSFQLNSMSDIGTINKALNTALNVNVKEKKQKIEVCISNLKTAKQRREIAQNSLNWVWCGDEAKQRQEYTPQEIHERNKLEYGIPIMCRDPDFAMLWQPFRYYIIEQKLRILKHMPITSIMSIEQMTEYLSTMKIDKESKGIFLNDKDDLFNKAMGRSKTR